MNGHAFAAEGGSNSELHLKSQACRPALDSLELRELSGREARGAWRCWNPPLLSAAVIARRDFCQCQMRVSRDLRASISSMSLVYSVWKTNRDLLTEDCPSLHAWWIEFHHRIASHRFDNTRHCRKVPCPCGHWQFSPQPVPLVVGQSSVYKTAADPSRTPRWIGHRFAFPGERVGRLPANGPHSASLRGRGKRESIDRARTADPRKAKVLGAWPPSTTRMRRQFRPEWFC
jgi:hypothetical protein